MSLFTYGTCQENNFFPTQNMFLKTYKGTSDQFNLREQTLKLGLQQPAHSTVGTVFAEPQL